MAAVRVPDVLMRVSPKMLDKYGSLCVAGAGRGRAVPLPFTFSRSDASTRATFIDRDGFVRYAAPNVPRLEWVDLDGDGVRETPGIRLEGSRTNGWDRGMELDHANWTKTGATVSANAVQAPDSLSTADALIESAANELHFFSRATPTLTDNTRTTISVSARPTGRSWLRIDTLDKSNTGRSTWFNVATGVVGTKNAGHDVFIEKRIAVSGVSWYRFSVSFDSASGATAPSASFVMALGDGGGAYAGDGASGMLFWGMEIAVDKPFPSSDILTTTGTVTRAADSLTVPFNFGPVDLTVYTRLARPVWTSSAGFSGARPWDIANAVAPRLLLDALNSPLDFRTFIDTPTTDASAALNVPAGAELKVCQQFRNLTSGGLTKIDVGSGFGSESSAATGFAAFGSQVIRIGTSVNLELYGVLLDLVIARGLFTLTEMGAVP